MCRKLAIYRTAIVVCLASLILLTVAAHSFACVPSLHEVSQTFASSNEIPLAEETLIAEIISQFSEQEIYKTVYDLQNFTARAYGHTGNAAAAAYLYNRFDSIHRLQVEYQGGDLKNLIATLPGLDESSNETYIVGAHYDSTSSDPDNAPGATDDASGVAIVLEFARIMSQYDFNHTLKFACWNAEENGFLGSLNYAAYASNNFLNIPLYVNLDSSSYDPYGRFILDIMYNDQSTWAANMLAEHNSLYGINFTLTYNVHTCGSDHRAFWQHGYTAVMTHEETHGPAHTPEDTIDKVSTSYAKKNGQLCMSVLARLAGAANVEGHDVEITNLTPSRTVASSSSPISISLTVRNRGSYSETFMVTTEANTQTLNQTQVTLDARTSTTLTFPWNTTSLPLGNYPLTAYASPVLNETDLTDNNRTGGPIIISIIGDITGPSGTPDHNVDMRDISFVAARFELLPSNPRYNPNADINGDNKVNMKDVAITASHFGNHYP